jgi:hypothetical protein
MDYNDLANRINLRRKVSIEDDELEPINGLDSDLWKVLVDEYDVPIKREWFTTIVKHFSWAMETNTPFQTWDVNVLNGWKVSPDLLQKFHEDHGGSRRHSPI